MNKLIMKIVVKVAAKAIINAIFDGTIGYWIERLFKEIGFQSVPLQRTFGAEEIKEENLVQTLMEFLKSNQR